MKTFREFYEEFRDVPDKRDSTGAPVKITGIYKNPTPAEWNDIPADARAFATKDGDLFVASIAGRMAGFHNNIIKSLSLTKFLPKSKTNQMSPYWFNRRFGIALQRVKKDKLFAFGEASGLYLSSGQLKEPELKELKDTLKKVKKNNKGVKFILKNIETVRAGT